MADKNISNENLIPDTSDVVKTEKKSGKKAKKKKNKVRIILIIILIILIIVGIVATIGVGIIYHYIGKVNIVEETSSYEILDSIAPDDDLTSEPDSPQEEIDKIEQSIKENVEKKPNKKKNSKHVYTVVDGNETYTYDFSDENVYNVLLIGTDARTNSDRGRSDSMILISINDTTEQVVMTSFLRDIYLYIPEVESTRLNHAYAYGGPELLLDTLETNFKIPIDKYVQVDFYSFVTVVDAVGGVDIDVTDDEVQYINSYLNEINNLEGRDQNADKLSSGGSYTLNGEQALAYSRIRYIGTDFGRTERQRTVLEQILRNMSSMGVSELKDLLDELLPNVTTNIQSDELFSLVFDSPSYLGYERIQCRVPADGTWWNLTIRGMAVLGIDFNANIRYLGQNIYNQY